MRLIPVSGLALALSLASSAYAGVVEEEGLPSGLYRLHNHDAGNAGPPGYGLRLDELVDVSADKDIFTFDFDHVQSNVRINISESTIHIFGNAYGGLNDDADGYAGELVGLWAIDFTYSFYNDVPDDDDRWTIGPDPADHYGTITQLFGDETDYWLQDEAGDHPYSFRLGDEDDDAGHKGFEGISGWGWLNHAPIVHDDTRNGVGGPTETFPHSYSSDWLFTVGKSLDPVPEPGSAALLGLGALAMMRRRR